MIKEYKTKTEADEDSLKMRTEGFFWLTGWYTVDGFCVEYRR